MRVTWIVLALSLAACSPDTDAPDYSLYLVRHAEKMADADDPELTIAGHTRAAHLAGWLEDKEVTAIWSSNFRRTMQTAGAVQGALGLPIQRYDVANLTALVADLKTAGENALVVGHSNTTPQLAALLCACAVAEMDDSDYDTMLVVEMRDGTGSVTTLSQAEAFGK